MAASMRRTFAVLWFGVLCAACGFQVQGGTDTSDAPMAVTVGFRSPTSAQDETSGTVMVPVALSAPAGDIVTVRYRFTGGTATPGADFEGTDGELTFAPGATEAAIPVVIRDDDLEEPIETIDLELSAPSNARLGASRHTVTIASDILPRIRFQMPASEGPESMSPELMLLLDLPAPAGGTVDYVVEGTAASGSDHALAAGTITIPPAAEMVTLPVPILDDALDEFDETVVVKLTSSTNVVVAAMVPDHTYTILNDDLPPTIAFGAATHTATEGGAAYELTVQLSAPSGKPISVAYSVDPSSTATEGTDFAFAQTTPSVELAPGETSKTVTINFPDDDIYEDPELAAIVLGMPVNATLGAAARLDLTILDNDPVPTVSWGAPEDQSANERDSNDRDFTYNLVLSHRSTKTITVPLTLGGSANASGMRIDFQLPNGTTITFPPGETTRPVLLRVIADNRDEDNETVIMTIDAGGVVNAVVGTPNQRTHTIIDDD